MPATLKQILDPATFAGIVFSDDAAVYANFTTAQKCWAHLLRKAIKLTLLGACQRRVPPAHGSTAGGLPHGVPSATRPAAARCGSRAKVADLDDEILELCLPMWGADCRRSQDRPTIIVCCATN